LVGSISSVIHHFTDLFFFSRNYDHVSALWLHEGWISEGTVDIARAHYAAYMVRRADGLRIITMNADLCASSLLLNAAISVQGRYLQGIGTPDSKTAMLDARHNSTAAETGSITSTKAISTRRACFDS